MRKKTFTLPQTILNYYHASEIYDDELLEECFAKDALLVDEGEEYHGPKAVSAHIMKANRSANVTTEITNCVENNEETVVTGTIAGDFEGSPVPLDFHFTLHNEKIKTLRIEIAGE